MSMFDRLADAFIMHFSRHAPEGKRGLTIGGKDDPYLKRWYVIPRNPVFNVYLHNLIRSDDDRALHDHPWWNVSIILKGGYIEIVPTRGATTKAVIRSPGSVTFRFARQSHRLVVWGARAACWTLFITGPRLRRWGFWCPKGWVLHSDFTGGPRGELVGRGCGEP